jgi:superfamily II DNA or RNA helicase
MTFSEKTKNAVAAFQDTETKDMHFDHVYPSSKGGSNAASNCQILTPETNIRKSNNTLKLRSWQLEFLKSWNQFNDQRFLMVAIPAGGKTIAALSAVNLFLNGGNDRKVIIVSPSINVQHQWQVKAAQYFGIQLKSKEFRADFKSGYHGVVATYQGLDSNAALFDHICGRNETMVVLDEVHHLSERASWGMNAQTAFGNAKKVLSLSGTPVRTDNTPIPLIEYSDAGFYVPSFSYGYKDALRDSVIRNLVFNYAGGDYTTATSRGEETKELSCDVSDDEAAKRLRSILNPGDFIEGQIVDAHEKLQEIRRFVPDAAAMAVCIDQRHASQIRAVIKDATGCNASVIVSDEEQATDTVDRFRKSKTEWVVSVRQVAEGTDIPRLQVLCYMTNATTEMFFRQLIGRVQRVRFLEGKSPSDDAKAWDREAYVFLPADPRLIEHAKNIEQLQLSAAERKENKPDRTWPEPEPKEGVADVFLGSNHNGTETVMIGSEQFSAEDAKEIKDIADDFAITYDRAVLVFRRYGSSRWASNGTSTDQDCNDEPTLLQNVEDDLRRECNKLANKIASRLNLTHSEVHMKYAKQETLEEPELRSKKASLQRWLQFGRFQS